MVLNNVLHRSAGTGGVDTLIEPFGSSSNREISAIDRRTNGTDSIDVDQIVERFAILSLMPPLLPKGGCAAGSAVVITSNYAQRLLD